MATELENRFSDSCRAAQDYPCQLLFPHTYRHVLDELRGLLDQHANNLFCIDSKAAIDFLELGDLVDGKVAERYRMPMGGLTAYRFLCEACAHLL